MTAACATVIDYLAYCGYEYFGADTTGDAVAAQYERLAALGKSEGFYPLIILVTPKLAEAIEFRREDYSLFTKDDIAEWRESHADFTRTDVEACLETDVEACLEMEKERFESHRRLEWGALPGKTTVPSPHLRRTKAIKLSMLR